MIHTGGQLAFNKKLRGWRFSLFILCLGLAHNLVLFNAGAYIAMLPRVAAGLALPSSMATWTQTDYMIGLALGFPLGNALSRRLGEYRPFIAALLAFGFFSAVCTYSDSLSVYLIARIFLGISGGITLPIGQSMALKEYPSRLKSHGTGLWSLFTLMPFSLGPLSGGWIADNLGWHWLFNINIAVACSIGAIIGALLFGRGCVKIKHRFDLTGFTLAAIAMLSLQTLLNQGNDWDWGNSLYLSALTCLTLAAFCYWIIWELASSHPFVDFSLFGHRNFTVGTTVLFIGFLFFQGLLSLLIVQLQVSLGYSSFLAALVFLPMAVFSKPVGCFIHLALKKYDARLLACLNLAGFSLVYFKLSQLDQSADYAALFWPKLFEGVCLGGFFVPLTALLLHGLPPERQWRAVELAGILRIAAGAIGITCQGIVFYRRLPFHLSRIAENRTDYDTDAELIANRLISNGFTPQQAEIGYLGIVKLQAKIFSMNDAFWLAGWMFAGLAAIVWLAEPTVSPMRERKASELRQEDLLSLSREE